MIVRDCFVRAIISHNQRCCLSLKKKSKVAAHSTSSRLCPVDEEFINSSLHQTVKFVWLGKKHLSDDRVSSSRPTVDESLDTVAANQVWEAYYKFVVRRWKNQPIKTTPGPALKHQRNLEDGLLLSDEDVARGQQQEESNSTSLASPAPSSPRSSGNNGGDKQRSGEEASSSSFSQRFSIILEKQFEFFERQRKLEAEDMMRRQRMSVFANQSAKLIATLPPDQVDAAIERLRKVMWAAPPPEEGGDSL